jgi:hypothetical protein
MSLEASWPLFPRDHRRPGADEARSRPHAHRASWRCAALTKRDLDRTRTAHLGDARGPATLRAQMDLRASHVRTYRVRASVRAHLRAATHVCMRTVDVPVARASRHARLRPLRESSRVPPPHPRRAPTRQTRQPAALPQNSGVPKVRVSARRAVYGRRPAPNMVPAHVYGDVCAPTNPDAIWRPKISGRFSG